MTPEESQHVIQQYQQWLADAQLNAAKLAAQLGTANTVIADQNATIEDLKNAQAAPKPGPHAGAAHA